MTIVLICIVVALGLAAVGAFLLLTGRREERVETGAFPNTYMPDGPVPPRVRRRAREEMEELPVNAPAPATPAATAAHAAATPVAAAAPMHAAARATVAAGEGNVQDAGHARLEAALERARSRLGDDT
jgi:hypothetical protein